MTKRNKNNRNRAKRNPNGNGIVGRDHAPATIQLPRGVFGFPDRLVTSLRYCNYHNLTCTSGALNNITYRWNSIFDPDHSGAGHQPLYHDTFAAVYDQYAVISAYAKVTIINPHATVSGVVGTTIDDDSTLSTTFQTLMEQSHNEHVVLTPLSGSRSETIFNRTWDCVSVLGIDPFASQTYKTAIGSDPTEVSDLGVWAIPADGSSTLVFNVTIEIVQRVLFTELKTPTQS